LTGKFNHFDFLAPFYEKFITPKEPEKLVSLAGLSTQSNVLDVGGGTGRVGQFLRGKARQIVLADQTLKMLAEAHKKEHLLSVCSHSEELPFAVTAFDRIIMVDTLHHVNDQQKTAQELWRVLKPGGRIVIEEPDIRTFVVKLIALAEKLLLMRSHFLNTGKISALFAFTRAEIQIHSEQHTIWVIVEKAAGR
jgi:demethylmenaquinone methyltransferase/2-methoxy-6-polyprenyl-1,4-benzoquinol methylase